MEKERLIWGDSLKGWLMILVILGHILQNIYIDSFGNNHLWALIYSFHMPTFMAVSGWFAYRNNRKAIRYKKTIQRRACQLLVPYLVWSIIKFAKSGNYTIDYLSKIILYPDTYFWFLWVLFWISFIFVCIQWITDKLKIDEILLLGLNCVVLMGLMVGLDFRIFGFQFISYYFLFYVFGYCLHRFDCLKTENYVVLIVSAVVWFFLAWSWSMHSLPSWMPTIPIIPASLIQYGYRCITAAIAIYILLSVFPAFFNGKSKLNVEIAEFGALSLGIYVVHLSFPGYITGWLHQILPVMSSPLYVCLDFTIYLVLSYVIVLILNKFNYTARFFLGKI